jgi:hypothetical protein
VAEAVAEFREDKAVPNLPGPETEFSVKVMRNRIEHNIRLKRVSEWAQNGNTKGPNDLLRRDRVRKLLA